MYRDLSSLLLYGDLPHDAIPLRLAELVRDWESGGTPRHELLRRANEQVRRLLELAAALGLEGSLWHGCLTWLLMQENVFTLACEGTGAVDGTLAQLARRELAVFRRLFDYDFGPLTEDLGCCSPAVCYQPPAPVREGAVSALCRALEQTRQDEDWFRLVTDSLRRYGCGVFALSGSFRVRRDGSGELLPVPGPDPAPLDELLGCQRQKEALRANTEAFLAGRSANNVLLCGDAGTGKSTSVRALVREYRDRGLRLIQLPKDQLRDLSAVFARIRDRNYRFILFLDDLSFEEDEVEYKLLKAAMEGGVESRPDNTLIYATSNRRALIRETWNDRSDMEHSGGLHRSDTVEEKTSLAARFGLTLTFSCPTPREYRELVLALAERRGLRMDPEELLAQANVWQVRHRSFSGRTARQLIDHLAGQP